MIMTLEDGLEVASEGGTFLLDADGTFETVLGGTIKPLLSKIGEAVSFRLFISDVIKSEGATPYDAASSDE